MASLTTDSRGFSLVFSRAFGNVIVHIHGALDAHSAPELKDRLVDVIDGQGNRQVVLDLREMTSIDCAGFAVLIDALKRMQRIGGDLVLSGPTKEVARAFDAADLDKVFVITPAWAHPTHGDGRSTQQRRLSAWGQSG